VTALTVTGASVASANVGTAVITTLTATGASVASINAGVALVTTGTVTNLTSTAASIASANVGTAVLTGLTVTNASIASLNAGTATITTGNLTFSGTAQRITGDMSNATVANRLFFQNSVTNGVSVFGVIPNGTATTSRVSVWNASDPTNVSWGDISVTSAELQLRSNQAGTGTYLPMTFYTGGSERMRIDSSTGNVGIGTASPGATLEVAGGAANGLTRIGQLQFKNSSGSYSAGADGVFMFPFSDGILYSDNYDGGFAWRTGTGSTERMRIDGSTGNVGIGGTAEAYSRLNLLGTYPTSSNATQVVRLSGTIPSGTTASYRSFLSRPVTQATAFTLTNLIHFEADPQTLGAGSAVTNQYGFSVADSLTGATNNYGFYSAIASGSNRWAFYAAGTARNYFAGRTDVGNTRIEATNNWNGAQVTSTSTVTLTAGSSIDLTSAVAGGALISVYVTGSGNGGLFWANYSATVTKLVGNGEATDTGVDFAVYKNAASHTTTLKNKSAGTQTFAVAILAGALTS
jgi:hypothetical protein